MSMIKLGGEDSKPPKPETDPGWEERLAEHKAKRQRLLLEAGLERPAWCSSCH